MTHRIIKDYSTFVWVSESKSFSEYLDLTEDEIHTINYLVHDKGHISYPKAMREVESVIRKYTEPAPVLYRGLRGPSDDDRNEWTTKHQGEMHLDFSVGTVVNIDHVLSFSEDIEVAKGFSEIVMKLVNAKGFSMWEYFIQDLNNLQAEDPDAYDSVDGDFLKEGYEEEKEWLIKGNTKYKVISVYQDEEYTIIECEMLN